MVGNLAAGRQIEGEILRDHFGQIPAYAAQTFQNREELVFENVKSANLNCAQISH